MSSSTHNKTHLHSMKVIVKSSKLVKPTYQGKPPSKTDYIPLNVFDKVTFNMNEALILAYRPPTPPNVAFEFGLQKVLSVYRPCAGRLAKNGQNELVILLNDEGVRFVEAMVESTLDEAMPKDHSPALLNLHPSLKGVEELTQIQLTWFTCGSMLLGYTTHHYVTDGQAIISFLSAWAQACRGAEISPLPCHDRRIFSPRKPPIFEFNHKNVEFINRKVKKDESFDKSSTTVDDIVVHKFHFTSLFLAKLKDKSSTMCNGQKTSFTTFESLVAHLWKTITKARSIPAEENTHVRIAVNGRTRLKPRVSDNYFGNLVLWAFPTSKVKDLLDKPLPYAAKLIRQAISDMTDNYFRSFIDFASYKLETEQLVPKTDADELVLCPNSEISSMTGFPFYKLDFGQGGPFIFMPTYLPWEGVMFLLPSFAGDGSIIAYVSLYKKHLPSFEQSIYSIDSGEVCALKTIRSSM